MDGGIAGVSEGKKKGQERRYSSRQCHCCLDSAFQVGSYRGISSLVKVGWSRGSSAYQLVEPGGSWAAGASEGSAPPDCACT